MTDLPKPTKPIGNQPQQVQEQVAGTVVYGAQVSPPMPTAAIANPITSTEHPELDRNAATQARLASLYTP